MTVSANALDRHGLRAAASALRSDNTAFQKAAITFGPLVGGQPAAVITATVAAERSTFTRLWNAASAAADQLRQITAADVHDNDMQLGRGRVTVLAVDALFAVIVLSAAIVVGQRGEEQNALGARHANDAPSKPCCKTLSKWRQQNRTRMP